MAAIVIGGSITDVDGSATAIAVTWIDNTNGVWQFKTRGGSWTDLSGTTAATVNLTSSARLLDSDSLLRFVPTGSWTGTATLKYRAWGKSTGSVGSTASASSTDGTTAFSSAEETASIDVV